MFEEFLNTDLKPEPKKPDPKKLAIFKNILQKVKARQEAQDNGQQEVKQPTGQNTVSVPDPNQNDFNKRINVPKEETPKQDITPPKPIPDKWNFDLSAGIDNNLPAEEYNKQIKEKAYQLKNKFPELLLTEDKGNLHLEIPKGKKELSNNVYRYLNPEQQEGTDITPQEETMRMSDVYKTPTFSSEGLEYGRKVKEESDKIFGTDIGNRFVNTLKNLQQTGVKSFNDVLEGTYKNNISQTGNGILGISMLPINAVIETINTIPGGKIVTDITMIEPALIGHTATALIDKFAPNLDKDTKELITNASMLLALHYKGKLLNKGITDLKNPESIKLLEESKTEISNKYLPEDITSKIAEIKEKLKDENISDETFKKLNDKLDKLLTEQKSGKTFTADEGGRIRTGNEKFPLAVIEEKKTPEQIPINILRKPDFIADEGGTVLRQGEQQPQQKLLTRGTTDLVAINNEIKKDIETAKENILLSQTKLELEDARAELRNAKPNEVSEKIKVVNEKQKVYNDLKQQFAPEEKIAETQKKAMTEDEVNSLVNEHNKKSMLNEQVKKQFRDELDKSGIEYYIEDATAEHPKIQLGKKPIDNESTYYTDKINKAFGETLIDLKEYPDFENFITDLVKNRGEKKVTNRDIYKESLKYPLNIKLEDGEIWIKNKGQSFKVTEKSKSQLRDKTADDYINERDKAISENYRVNEKSKVPFTELSEVEKTNELKGADVILTDTYVRNKLATDNGISAKVLKQGAEDIRNGKETTPDAIATRDVLRRQRDIDNPVESTISNRIIDIEAYNKAKKSFSSLPDNAFSNPAGFYAEKIKDLSIIGAYHIESGIRNFADFSKKMIDEVGNWIRPHLKNLWNEVKDYTTGKKSFELPKTKDEIIASSWSKQNIENALERFYQKNSDIYESKKEFFDGDIQRQAMELESDFETMNRYFKSGNLPEDIFVADILKAYYDNKLPSELSKNFNLPNSQIENISAKKIKALGQPQERPTADIKNIYEKATQRPTTKNKNEVIQARKDLFIEYNADPELANKLGIKQSELNKKIRQYTGYSEKARQTEQIINKNIPEQYQWKGISNVNYINKGSINPKVIDSFVKKIITGNNARGLYGNNGEMLRRYIVNSFLGIDTRIEYKDLTFIINRLEKALGQYTDKNKTITIDNLSEHTITHEIGHYLDYKWAKEFGNSNSGLTELFDSFNKDYVKEKYNLADEHLNWGKKFYDFVMDISERSAISSEYLQRRSEVFARFTNHFVNWANELSTGRKYDAYSSHYRGDKFNVNDYHNFAKLLQEKSYLDEKYNIKNNPLTAEIRGRGEAKLLKKDENKETTPISLREYAKKNDIYGGELNKQYAEYTKSFEKLEVPKEEIVKAKEEIKTINTTSYTKAETELLDKLKTVKDKPLTERLKFAKEDAINKVKENGIKDKFNNALESLKSTAIALWDAYKNPPKANDINIKTREWTGSKNEISKVVMDMQENLKNKVPDKLTRRGINAYIESNGDIETLTKWKNEALEKDNKAKYERALNLTDTEKQIANDIKQWYDDKLKLAQEYGVIESGVENYINHKWKKKNPVTGELQNGFTGNSTLKTNFENARKRIFETNFEGEQKGYKSISDDIADNIGFYSQGLDNVISDRIYVKSLTEGKGTDGRPLVAPTGIGTLSKDKETAFINPTAKPESIQDYISLNHPALRNWKWGTTIDGNNVFVKGDLAVHPEFYPKLKNVLGQSALKDIPVYKQLRNIQKEIKGLIFTLSPFHIVQEGTHAVGHEINPFSRKLPEFNPKNETHRKAVNSGLQLYDYNSLEAVSEGLSVSNIGRKIPFASDIQDLTFKKVIPKLKLATWEKMYEGNTKLFKKKYSDAEISMLTSDQVNAAYGHLNYKAMFRNPTVQDAFRFLALAPDFLEARTKFVGQAMKPTGVRQLKALMVLAGTMYLGARTLNKLVNDDWEFDDPKLVFGVKINDKVYDMRSVPGDMLELAEDPRRFIANRISPIGRTLTELLTQKDWQGRPIDFSETLKSFAMTFVPSILKGRQDMTIWQNLLSNFGFRNKTYRTSLETKINEEYWKYNPPGKISDGTKEKSEVYNKIRDLVKAGKTNEAEQVFTKAQEQGLIKDDVKKTGQQEYKEFLEKLDKGVYINRFKQLPVEVQKELVKEMNEEEKKKYFEGMKTETRKENWNKVDKNVTNEYDEETGKKITKKKKTVKWK